jgi:DNA-binding NtrC family response regulator
MQALLLRFLESGEVQPVGADSVNRRVDTRVITATNRDLTAMAKAGQFRADVMYRIRVMQIHVPALRERPADIRPLAQHFLHRLDPQVRLTEEAWDRLEAYDWPGNVRELQNLAEQLACLFSGCLVQAQDLPSPLCRAEQRAARGGRDRRRSTADELFAAITNGTASFWHDLYARFIDRELTRKDVRDVVARGLAASQGNYRELVRLFRLHDDEYKRLLNCLVRHDCAVDYRPFRRRSPSAAPTLLDSSGMPVDPDAIAGDDMGVEVFGVTH